jgi:F-type H+-transporting ATPase subunit delta
VAESIDGKASEAAERYAQAAFELALEAGALDALEKDFKTFGEVLKESADLRFAIASPLIDSEEKAGALVAVADKLGFGLLSRNVFGVVAKNGRAAELPQIAKAFRALTARHRGAKQVEIVSATPLAQPQLDAILQSLQTALGGKIEPVTRVDESLIGGFIVQAGSRQFDASLKTKLNSLKLALKGA